MRNTKIICTIGPASEKPEILKKLMLAGMNVARLNFSHGTHEGHAAQIKSIRSCAKEIGRDIAIMLDTKGPEIRTGILENGKITLKKGNCFILTTEQIIGNEERVSITYEKLAEEINVGATILIDDGLIELQVESINGSEIHCRVVDGGILKNQKGVNLPKVSLQLPGITEKDISDITFGLQMNVDFIAASFVRKASDILEIRKIVEEYGTTTSIIAKIENEEGVENANEILEAADGLMVARGDLGVEIPIEEVPLVQKKLIANCHVMGKPVITATQMLDSMQHNPRPTRAEASDVANAIFDGTDAIMLSGETAAGAYPVESVEMMNRIAMKVENSWAYKDKMNYTPRGKVSITDAMGKAVTVTAQNLNAKAILTPTESGYTANTVSKYRPSCPIIALTPHERVLKRLQLVWGVHPILFESTDNTDEMMKNAIQTALRKKGIKEGDLTLITAGLPVHETGTTNMMKVHIVGDTIIKAQEEEE